MAQESTDVARAVTRSARLRRAVRSRARSGRSDHGRRAGEDGSSLLEVLIAVFLVSMVVLGLATAFISLMRINRANAEQQRVDHAVDNVAEQLKAVPYVSTGDRLAAYRAQVPPAAAGEPTVTLTLVECRVRGAAASDDLYDPACTADSGTQRVTIRGEFLDRSRNAQVVVRNR